MVYSDKVIYGGAITVSLPTSGSWSLTTTQKLPEERNIFYIDGPTGSNSNTYTHVINFPQADCAVRGRTWRFLNTNGFSSISVTFNGLIGFGVPAFATTMLYMRHDNSWNAVTSRFSTMTLSTDSSATPSQFIIFGQAQNPKNGTYMYSSASDVWTTKANRPASSTGCIGGDVSSGGSSAYGSKAPYNAYNMDGSSMWLFASNNTFTSKASCGNVDNDGAAGVYNNGVRYLYINNSVSGGSMELNRYTPGSNTWTNPGSVSGFNHSTGILVETSRVGSSLFLIFGTSDLSTKAVRAAHGPDPISFNTYTTPPSGPDFASSSVVLGNDKVIYVFGGSAMASVLSYGNKKLRTTDTDNWKAWRNGMPAPNVIFGQACFRHHNRYRVYLMAGINSATGYNYLTHQYYDSVNEAYVATASRAWVTAGGYRHAARAHIDWMS